MSTRLFFATAFRRGLALRVVILGGGMGASVGAHPFHP
jgi:hypothetical protein